MALRMTPSPAASALFKALGAEESSAATDLDAGDQAEYPASADSPRYGLSLKRKRATALLRHMLENAGMGELARNVNIRQHGGYSPHGEGDHD